MHTSEHIKHPIPAVAAVMVENGRILLIKRGAEPSKGKWSIPGGSVEWGETLVEALKREVREETGLEAEIGDVAAVFDLIVEGESGITFHYVIIDYFSHPTGGALSAGDDAVEALWVPIEDIDEYELTEHLRSRLPEMGIV